MNEIFATLVDSSAGLTQYAFNLLLQSTALIVIGLIVGWTMRRHGSAVQSAIYRATLVTVLVCPLAAITLNVLGFQGWTVQIPSPQQMVTYEVSEAVTETPPPVEVKQVDDQPQSSPAFVDKGASITQAGVGQVFTDSEIQSEHLEPTTPISSEVISVPEPVFETRTVISPTTIAVYGLISLLWIAGALLLLSRVIFAYRRLNVLRQQSSVADETERAVCESMAQRINVSLPEIRRNSLLSSPCLTGIAAPAILLPAEINERILLEKAFAHELGHLRRRDTLWNLIQRITLAFFFFQPLLWRLVYRLETTAEEVCDDYVVRHCQDPAGYAQQLVELAESNLLAPNMAGLGMFKTNRSMLGQRVVRILDSTRTLTTQISGPIVGTIIALAFVCATLGGFIGNGSSPFAVFTSTEAATDESENEDADPLIKLSGRVLDSQQRPAVGADIYVLEREWENGFGSKQIILGQTKTVADGRYELSIHNPARQTPDAPTSPPLDITVAAFSKGLGPKWKPVELTVDTKSIESDLQLSKTKPYSWQLVDIDGQPVVGATIRVSSISRRGNAKSLDLNNESHEVILQSDKRGRFTIDSLGSGYSAHAFISGNSIAMRTAYLVLKTPAEYETQGNGTWKSNGQNFADNEMIVCAPGMDVAGVVRDSKSGKPIGGATVKCGRVFNYDLRSVSDANGRYRISGIPISNRLWLRCDPPADQPYLKQDFTKFVTTETSHNVDMELNRGIWIEGTVKDLDTGKPVPKAIVYHFPLADNPYLDRYPEYDGRFKGPLFNKHYFTDEDGHYRMVGIPGPAVMGVRAGGALGTDSEKPAAKRKLAMMYSTKIDDKLNRIEDVDFSFDASVNKVDFEVAHGKSIELKTVDPTDKPISGVYVTRLNVPETNSLGAVMNEARFWALNFVPGKNRLLKFVSPERKLGIVQEIGLPARANGNGQNNSDPVNVQLQPFATVKFRLVDDQGDPVFGITSFEFDSGQQLLNPQPTPIDANGNSMLGDEGVNGNFVYDDIVAGTNYVLRFQPSDSAFPVFLHADLAVSPGEVIDLGTINVDADKIPGTMNIDSKNRPEPKRTFISSTSDQKQNPANKSADESVTLTGTVVDSNGKPVAGAKVYRKTIETTSGVDGSFKLEIAKSEMLKFKGQPMLLAAKDGYGRAFCPVKASMAANSIKLKDSSQLKLVLPDDNHPIAGKLVDPEGNPIANATIEIKYIKTLNNIAEYLEAAARDQATLRDLPGGMAFDDERINKFQSDSKGNFSIVGIGIGRVVQLKIMGDDIALTKPMVVTAKTEPLTVYREAGMFGDQFGKIVIYGHQPTIVCEPTQVITGVVVDRESGEPLVGVDIYSDRFSDVPISGIRDLKTATDKDGRFRLLGMPIGPDNTITAFPPAAGEAAMPYLARDIAVPTAKGLEPVDIRIELQRGTWVRGKVVDKQTGLPIAAARITYKPYIDNVLAEKLYSDFRIPDPIGFLETKEDGLFQVVALPGKALLDVWVVREPYFPPGQGWEDIPAERKDHLGNILSQGFPSNHQHPTAMKEINVIDRQPIDDLVYELDPGKSILVKLQDPAGNPLQGVQIGNASSNVNQDFHAKDQSEFQATGFLEGQRRTLTFYHKDRNLGQFKTIGDGDESPVIVALQPNARITGKLVDSDGDPLPRANIRFDLAENMNYFIKHSPFKYITDENGVFDQIAIPGRYKVQVETLDGFYVLNLAFDIAAGDQIDLGTLDVAAISKRILDELNGRAKKAPPQEPGAEGSDDKTDTTKGQAVDLDSNPNAAVVRPDYYIILNLDVDGKIKFEGQEIEKIESFGPILAVEIKNAAREGVVNPGDIAVIIRSHEDTPKKLVQELVSKCRASELENFTFRVKEEINAGQAENNTGIIKGSVVDLNGIAVPDAEVSRLETKTMTDGDGKFSIQISESELEKFPDGRPYVSIRKEGYGYSFGKIDANNKQPLTLVNDDHPIEGQLVDTEGNPISGATIRLERFTHFEKGVLDTALATASQHAEPLQGLPRGVGSGDEEIKPVTSDAHGKFTIRGVGSGRLAYLAITGENTAIRKAIVATTDHPNVKYKDPQANFLSDGIIHNRKPVLTCEPSQPVEGIVLDRDTKRPLAGFNVTSYGFLNDGNNHFIGQTDLKTTTDEQGHFRLNGMPKGKGNSIIVTAPTAGEFAQPYITQIADVPDAPGIEPIQMEVMIQRGVWISGNVSDADNGKPIVGAAMQYMPLDENEMAPQLDRRHQDLLGSDYYGPRTDEQGNFRFVGIPGPAIIGPWVLYGSNYPPDRKMKEVPASQKVNGRITSSYFRTPNPHVTAFKRIDVAKEGLVDLRISISKGKSVRIKTVDNEGNLVDGVNVSFIPTLVQNNLKTKAPEFDIGGFLPNHKRTIVLLHNDKKIGAVATIDANVSSPHIVTLAPLATVTAKLVDDKGEPAVGTSLRFSLISKSRNVYRGMQPSAIARGASDEKGTFSQSMIAGEYVYSISSFNNYSGEKRIKLAAGESVDLGTIVVTEKLAEPIILMQPKAQPALPPTADKNDANTNKNEQTNPAGSKSGIKSIQGSVVDENDRPVADADVTLRLRYRPSLMDGPIANTTTDSKGNFKLQYQTDSVSQYPRLQQDDFNTAIEVSKEGFARGWVDVCQIANSKTTVKLSSKVVDVDLNLIDPEGNPIQGTVFAEISNIGRFNQPLEEIISQGGNVDSELRKAMPVSGRFYVDSRVKFKADEKGRIQFKNLGDNRLYWVSLKGSAIANRYFQFATGIKSDKKYNIPADNPIEDDEQVIIFATGSRIVCEQGQTVTGVVRDGNSGQPIPGAQLIGSYSPALRYSILNVFHGRSDAQGRFKISGLGVGGQNTLFAVKHSEQPYVSRYLELPTTEIGKPLEFDVKMFRGGRINVQVIDAATSEPIPAARVYFAPLQSNPANENYPEHNLMGIFSICPGETPLTDNEGKCELSGMIGQGIIGVRIHNSKYRQGQGGEEITQALGAEAFPPLGGIRDFVTTRHAVSSHLTAVKLIEVKEVDEITEVRVEIDTSPVK